MREKVVFCWPKVVICMKPSRQKIEQCEGKVEQRIFRKVFFPYSIHFDNHSSTSCCLCKKHGWSGRSGLETYKSFDDMSKPRRAIQLLGSF